MKSILKLSFMAALFAPILGGFLPVLGGMFALALIPTGVTAGTLNISVLDAQGLFTKTMVTVYKEKVTPKGFLSSFFKPFETLSHELSIAVKRGSEMVAVDVHRHTNGNHNKSTKMTEKIIIPPFYKEFLTANQHRLYNQVITAISRGDMTFFAEMTKEIAEDLVELRYKIERAIELQCSQVFEDGIIQLEAGVNIDFKRKAASKVNKGVGNYWDTNTVSPYKDLENGCTFLKETGKMSGSVVTAIMGTEALSLFLGNEIVQKRNDIRRFNLDDIRKPEDSNGASFHGEVVCGSYTVRLFSYPETYTDKNGVVKKFVNPKKVVLLPDTTNFSLGFAAVPQLIKDGMIEQKGRYLINEFYDYENTAHKIYISAAPVAIPVAIDQIYTVQVVS